MMLGKNAVYSESDGNEYPLALLDMFDLTDPGETCKTSMLNGLHSMVRTSLISLTAAFEALYSPFQGVALQKKKSYE